MALQAAFRTTDRNLALLSLLTLGRAPVARRVPHLSHVARGMTFGPLSKSVTTGMALVGTADIVSQRIEAPSAPWDSKRTMRFLLWGACFNGVVFHKWYQTYLPRIMARLTGNALVNRFPVASKIVIDQLTLSPLLYILFPVFHGLAEGKDLSKVQEKTGDLWWKIAMCDWTFYPAVQAINFAFLPASYHTFYVQASSFIFNVGMSYINKE